MKRYLITLEWEEVITLIRNNNGLQAELFDRCINCADMTVNEEWLFGCPAEWQIGSYCQGEHFRITGSKLQFREWFERVQYMYNLFNVLQAETIEQYTAGNDDLKEEIETMIYNICIAEYNAAMDIETQADYFITEYMEECEKWYTDNNLTNIYRDIPLQVVPAHVETIY